MHIRAKLEPRACSGTSQPVAGIVAAIGGGEEGKFVEALADAFELQEAWEEDVDVWFATTGFVEAFDCGGAHDANGDVLRDGGFAVALGTGVCADVILDTPFWIAVEFFVEVVKVVGLGAGAGEATAETAGRVARASEGVGDDSEREEWDIISFGEAQRGGCGAEG